MNATEPRDPAATKDDDAREMTENELAEMRPSPDVRAAREAAFRRRIGQRVVILDADLFARFAGAADIDASVNAALRAAVTAE